ncbi:hypothetical protein ILUMI_07738 [Ignelater luminosus]|uniref:Uncharacterized protein n=1 Tax=Ignelater luminosus TaxID=2038154 RepID=A0A8K0D6X0_IGNLU|nr:hypothetical protein ILUMI_07738 [Ignelater luminosus]
MFTIANKLQVLKFWTERKIAGENWLAAAPKIRPAEIFNLDETRVFTVPQIPKDLSKKGAKVVGQVATREGNENVTQVKFVSTIGNGNLCMA